MSQSKIYVGNLPYSTTAEDLEGLFGQYGAIKEAKLIMDRETGRSKGFAFITFDSESAAQDATAYNGTEMDGRAVKVSIARENNTGGGGRERF